MKCADCMWYANDCHYALGNPDYYPCRNFKGKNDTDEMDLSFEEAKTLFNTNNPYQE